MMFIASAVTLVPMIISDIRTREVNVLWLLLFAAVQIYFNGISNVPYNMFIVLFMLLGIYVYIILRYGCKTKITDYFGTGDIIFLFTLTAAFPIKEYTYFLITGLIISILCWLLMTDKKTVPLVSTLGFTYLIWILFNTF